MSDAAVPTYRSTLSAVQEWAVLLRKGEQHF